MIVRDDLARMKEMLDNIVGQEIQLTLRRGQKRAMIRRGVLEKTYPNIFIIKLQAARGTKTAGRRISYSYADVLTKAVEIALLSEKEA